VDEPAIAAFLDLLEADIQAGLHVRLMPGDLARAMLANAGRTADLDGYIEGDVAL